jgi:hypothetical protein
VQRGQARKARGVARIQAQRLLRGRDRGGECRTVAAVEDRSRLKEQRVGLGMAVATGTSRCFCSPSSAALRLSVTERAICSCSWNTSFRSPS